MKTPLTHPAHWARLPRYALLLLTALVCGSSGLAWHVQQCALARDTARQHLHALRQRLQPALVRVAGLPARRTRHGQLAMLLAGQSEQLWSEDDLPQLRDKLNRRATECALTLASFRPLERAQQHGAELVLGGGFAGMHCFVERATQLPRPIHFEQLDISASTGGGLQVHTSVHVALAAPPDNSPNASPAPTP